MLIFSKTVYLKAMKTTKSFRSFRVQLISTHANTNLFKSIYIYIPHSTPTIKNPSKIRRITNKGERGRQKQYS